MSDKEKFYALVAPAWREYFTDIYSAHSNSEHDDVISKFSLYLDLVEPSLLAIVENKTVVHNIKSKLLEFDLPPYTMITAHMETLEEVYVTTWREYGEL